MLGKGVSLPGSWAMQGQSEGRRLEPQVQDELGSSGRVHGSEAPPHGVTGKQLQLRGNADHSNDRLRAGVPWGHAGKTQAPEGVSGRMGLGALGRVKAGSAHKVRRDPRAARTSAVPSGAPTPGSPTRLNPRPHQMVSFRLTTWLTLGPPGDQRNSLS